MSLPDSQTPEMGEAAQETTPSSSTQPSEPSPSTETTTNAQQDQEQSSSSSPPPRRCDSCSALPQSELKPLKPCTKCQTVFYCDRDCQKKHFKVHKKVCAAAAQEYAMSANLKVESSRRAGKDNRRGGLQKWQFDT